MTKIDLTKFLENNYDEFVHLRALKNVIDQIDQINDSQNQAIGNKTAIAYQKNDNTQVNVSKMAIVPGKQNDEIIGKAFVCLDDSGKPIIDGTTNDLLLSVNGANKLYLRNDEMKVTNVFNSISNDSGFDIKLKVVNYDGDPSWLLVTGTIFATVTGATVKTSGGFDLTLANAVNDSMVLIPDFYGSLFLNGSNVNVTIPVKIAFDSTTELKIVPLNGYTDLLSGMGVDDSSSYKLTIICQ